MTVFEDATEAIATDPKIRVLHGRLSKGDVSVLLVMLDHENGIGTTTTGSPNAKFWGWLSKHGWMAQSNRLPPEAPTGILQYSITDRGYRAIPVLLSLLASTDN